MTKKKKKTNKKSILVNAAFIAVAILLFLVGYVVAKNVTEKKIAKHASTYIYKAKETLDLVCNNIKYDDPYENVDYVYNITCYYSDAKSSYNAVHIAVDNNGIVRSIDFNIPAETDKSKEENYIKIEDIVKRTNEAIMSSGLDVKRLNLNNSLFDLFKIEFENRTYEQDTFVAEIGREQSDVVEFNSQNDETPFIPAYFRVLYRG